MVDYGQIIGAVNDTLGGVAQTVVNHRFADQSWKRQKKVLQNQMQWRVRDLKAAGLNPILAAGSFGGGGAPSVATPQSADFGQSSSRGRKVSIESQLAEEQKNTLGTQQTANNASAAASQAKATRDTAGVETERATQQLLGSQAELASTNARVQAAQEALIQENIPKAKAMAEMWEDPKTRRMMQLREAVMPSGVMSPIQPPSMSPNQKFESGARRNWRSSTGKKLVPLRRLKR